VGNELLEGGWIANCYQNLENPCPEDLLRHIFSKCNAYNKLYSFSVCFSKDQYTAVSAFRTLETLLTGQEVSLFISSLIVMQAQLPFILGLYPSSIVQVDSSETKEWTPKTPDFIEIFKCYGAKILPSIGPLSISLPSPKQVSKHFPLQNFRLVIEYLGLCVSFR
jgi:hypothetical protein